MSTLEITTQIGCKNNCYYCPQNKIVKNYKSETKKLSFLAFIKYLKKIPIDTKLHFSGFSESFLNESTIYMVEYAFNKGYDIGIYTTTIGMTTETIYRLSKIKIDPFIIHVPDIFQKIDFKEWLNNVKKMDEYEIDFSFITVGYEKKPDNIDEYLSKTNREIEHQEIISRAGNYYDVESKKHDVNCNRKVQNVLLPDGRIVMCCMDYSLDYIIGDLNKQYYHQIKQIKNAELCKKCFRGVK